jgi:hypothetical protein
MVGNAFKKNFMKNSIIGISNRIKVENRKIIEFESTPEIGKNISL